MTRSDQIRFAARIRNPAAVGLVRGVSAERMAVYEQLFFNNLESFLAGGFPVLRSVLSRKRWLRLVRGFLDQHRCQTPYFLEIGAEFVAWLAEGFVAEKGDPAFLAELAHYERVELALDVDSAELPESGWSPLAWPLAYVWPVQRLGRDFLPSTAPSEPTCLLAWRDHQDLVRFQQLSPFAYHLALCLQAGEQPSAALRKLAVNAGRVADKHYFANAFLLLEHWHKQDIWFPPSA